MITQAKGALDDATNDVGYLHLLVSFVLSFVLRPLLMLHFHGIYLVRVEVKLFVNNIVITDN